MRFIVREQGFEKLVASGQFRYARKGVPTGTLESWRITSVVDGYQIVRVDLDARAGESGDSYLYHLTLTPAGTPVRLGFRFFRPGTLISGNVLFDDDTLSLSREVNGVRVENGVPAGQAFWFPATVGLSQLTHLSPNRPTPAVTLNKADDFALWSTTVSLTEQAGAKTFRWADQERTIWLDAQGWPTKMQRGTLTAVETRLIRH